MLKNFKTTALLEGISYLVLLCLAMPLKYMAGMPGPVKYVGWIHGLLFILYVILLIPVMLKYKWPLGKTFIAFVAALLPFGTFVLNTRVLKKEIN